MRKIKKKRRMMATFLLAVTGTLTIGVIRAESTVKPIDVCNAVDSRTNRQMTIRGLLTESKDMGLVLVDSTCPAATSGKNRMPSFILIENLSYLSAKEETQFNKELRDANLFQALLSGKLECRSDFIVNWKTDGDVVGNGYGVFGLCKCKLSQSRLVFFQKQQPSSNSK